MQPGGAARGFGMGTPTGVDVEKIAAQQLVALAEAINQLKHQRGAAGRVLPRAEEEAIAQDRAERTHAQQLGVVAQPKLSGELGKGLVKDKFAVAVALEIKGSHADQALTAPEAEMAGLPALVRHDAAAALEGLQPLPAVEGQPRGLHQLIPLLLGDLRQLAMPAGLHWGVGLCGAGHIPRQGAAKPNQAGPEAELQVMVRTVLVPKQPCSARSCPSRCWSPSWAASREGFWRCCAPSWNSR